MNTPAPAAPRTTPPSAEDSLDTGTPALTGWRRIGRWVRPLLWLNLAVEIGIVLTGGLVRLTGSGLGCPTWPHCDPGSFTPVIEEADGIHPYIEFGNRTLTGVVGIVAMLLVLAVVARGGERRRKQLPWALAVVGGIVAQIVLGGITVRTHLNPVTVSAHFLVSMLLVTASAAVLWFDRSADEVQHPPLPRPLHLVAGLAAVTAAVVLTLGTVVTGSGPHSGDADAPARYLLDVKTMSWLHADSVMLFCGLVAAMLLGLHLLPQATTHAKRVWWAVLAVTLAQGLLGYVQYALAVPAPLVALHMLGACLLVWALTWGVLAVRR
ncbi:MULTISPECIES: COX15/CtaA family protein [Kytococcus]|uniref:COX15/CtaA family protein n=1 Tax=Kytococcus TaxID=57499 RepID=UPI000B0F5AB9|nr:MULTISPECIES: COX15/CtaA family protein [Kytococcus]